MPSTYAHYVFGKKVLQSLPPELSALARGHRQLYDIGLHGPDILFYYRALTVNKVNSVGFGMHARPARGFFARAVCHELDHLDGILYTDRAEKVETVKE